MLLRQPDLFFSCKTDAFHNIIQIDANVTFNLFRKLAYTLNKHRLNLINLFLYKN